MAKFRTTYVRRWTALCVVLFLGVPSFASSVSAVTVVDGPSPGVPAACVMPTSDPTLVDVSVVALVCPGVVESLTVTPGLNSAVLSWQQPVNVDATQVTSYVIDVRSQSRVVAVAASETTATVTGLANGLEVEFVMYAVNELGAGPASPSVTTTPTTGVEGEVAGLIVKFATDVSVGDTIEFVGPFDTVIELPVVDEVASDVMLVKLPESISVNDAEAIADEIADEPGVEWVEPDQFLFISETGVDGSSAPNDTQWTTAQWNLWGQFGVGVADGNTDVADGWSQGSGKGSVVAVIDTGITSHPDLDQQIVAGYDFVSDSAELAAQRQVDGESVPFDGDYVDVDAFGALGRDDNPTDPGDWRDVAPVRSSTWHGTAMAGVIGARANDSLGVAGVAPSARVQPVRALSWRGGLLSDIAASITWASGGSVDGAPANATPANVINLSFAVEATCPSSLQDAIDGAVNRGAVVIAAAGNASSSAALFAPGNCDGVVNVSATDRDGRRAPYSNWGTSVDVSAPGGSSNGMVTTTSNSGNTNPANHSWGAAEGTSVAAAHVAGASAVLRGANPSLTVAEVVERLTGREYVKKFSGATCDSDPSKSCGSGILDLAQIAMARQGSTDHALDLNGTNQYVVGVGSSTAFKSLNAFTLQTWVRPDVGASCSGDKVLIRKQFDFGLWCGQSSGVNHWWYLLGRDGASPASQNTNIPILAGQWQHLALTRVANQDVVNFYVNGQLAYTGVTGGANGGAIRSSDDDLEIGSYLKQYSFFPGDIDEVRLYSAALSQAQIVTDMHTYGMNSAISAGDHRAHFDFNEGSGTTVYNRASGAPSTSHLTTFRSPNFFDVKTTTTSGSDTVVTFPRTYLTSVGGWVVPHGVSTAQYLVVGGGGGGGSRHGGGGGAGGMRTGSAAVVGGSASTLIVGQGGRGVAEHSNAAYAGIAANNGQDSSALSLTSLGGGRGSAAGGAATSGGSGGAAQMATSFGHAIGLGTAGQGNNGGQGSGSSGYGGGGGGGAGAVGSDASANTGGAGGVGLSSSISGSAVFYAGGGGGGGSTGGAGAAGGNGGGGAGKIGSAAGDSGSANTGGGGGAGGYDSLNRQGGSGGSGVVIVRYATSSVQCTPERVTDGSYTFVAFKNVGTCSWSLPIGVTNVDYLVVAGGGGGGAYVGGGGGAGGLLSGAVALGSTSSLTLAVGDGGKGGGNNSGEAGTNGGNTSLSGTGITTVNAIGGGGGGGGGQSATTFDNGRTGGSGGGSTYNASFSTIGNGTPGQGNNGALGFTSDCYAAGGGGGAGAVGSAGTNCVGGNGGIGAVATLLTPETASRLRVGEIVSGSVRFAGGGAGGLYFTSTRPIAVGGSGGGGAGSQLGPGTAGIDFTGGGGGGGGGLTEVSGGDGGSGVVVLRYDVQDVDYAMSFNGTSQYARGGAVSLGTGNITIEAWVKLASACSDYGVAVRQEEGYLLMCEAGKWKFGTKSQAGGTWTFWTASDVQQGQWQHLAVSRSASGAVAFYVDGQVVLTGLNAPLINSASDLSVGGDLFGLASNRGFFPGSVDEVKLWNSARTQVQIAGGMHARLDVSDANLQAYYDFNEGTGTTVFNRKSGAASTTNLATTASPTFADVKTTSVLASGRSVVSFPRSYITAVGGWTVPQGVSTADVLAVGGGGGGGGTGGRGFSAGGGAGGSVQSRSSFAVTSGATVPVTVGLGGRGGSATLSSTVNDLAIEGGTSSFGAVVAVGGGRGGHAIDTNYATSDISAPSGASRNGGGGGAQAGAHAGATGLRNGGAGFGAGSGFESQQAAGGGAGAGGNGVAATAGTAGAGGVGTPSSVTGSAVTYGGGGGGGKRVAGGSAGAGGAGGGGAGGLVAAGSSGTISRGGGGGGAGGSGLVGGAGGSGVVIVSYGLPASTTTCTNPVTTQALDGSGDIVVTFTTVESCTWTPPVGVDRVNVLVVGGGGGGGFDGGGGGGGGGVLDRPSTSVAPGVAVSVSVGAGGTGASTTYLTTGFRNVTGQSGGSGGSSVFGSVSATGGSGGGGIRVNGSSSTSGDARGGGGGGGSQQTDFFSTPVVSAGGSGGVGCTSCTGGSGLWQRGGGGGSGAGASGTSASGSNGSATSGHGAEGVAFTAFGATVYGSGGGGGDWTEFPSTSRGLGGTGAGHGGLGAGTERTQGSANTGGGGGGGGRGGQTGGSGGSGVVIVRYTPVDSTCTPLTYTSGGFTVVEFQTVGTCTWSVPSNVSTIDVLAVGGGGGGGSRIGGGGGGGGVVQSLGLTASGTATITVGTGGAGGAGASGAGDRRGANGESSKVDFANSALTDVTALGGGGGSAYVGVGDNNGKSAATGGGATWNGTAGTGSAGGNGGAVGGNGTLIGAGGGGGGGTSGTVGGAGSLSRGGAGGAGTSSSLTGAAVTYGGAGGGGTHNGGSTLMAPGLGGAGGGGTGGTVNVTTTNTGAAGFEGVDGLGGGGGGGSVSDGIPVSVPGGAGGDGTIIVRYTSAALVTITYDDNVANETITVASSQSGAVGSTVTVGAAPSRTGYTFAGWNTAETGLGTAVSAGSSYAMPASSSTLYAQWTANSYTVTYNANGGTGGPSSSSVQFGATATVAITASNPTRLGHTFASWATNADGTGSSYQPSATFTMGAANVTLYAQWTVNSYTVSYNDNVLAETISVPTTQTADYEGSVTVGAAPTRTGHSFAGWNTAANGSGTAYSVGASITIPASNTMLNAQWNVNTYTVSYNLNGGSGIAPASQTADFDTLVTVAGTSSTRTGFTFVGWNTQDDGTGTAKAVGGFYTVPAAPTTMYAQWTANQYTVTFNANDDVNNVATGLPSAITGRTYQQNVTLPSTEPTRPSYVFNGWNIAADGSGTSYAMSGSLDMPASNVPLYAQWVPANFGVVYNANGGAGAPAPSSNAFGSTVTVSSAQPTRTGHTFRWWTVTQVGGGGTYRNPATGNSANSFTMPGSQVTLFAQWQVNSYVVAYNANLGSNAPASQSADYDSLFTASSVAPTKAGYQFLGWNTSANGSGTSYAGGGTFQMPAANVTLFAQWQAITYSVTYNVNGGASTAPVTQSATTDATVTVSATVPTRVGYDFAGWNTLANGFGTPRTSSGTFTMPAGYVTLFAQWSPQTLSISYNGNGGTGVPGGQTGVVDSPVTISPTAPTRDGYTFVGWNTESNGSGTSRAVGATFVMPTSAVVFFAQWQAIRYSVTYEANNGTGAPTASSHIYLETVTLSSTIPTRVGYWFNGWNTTADGSGAGYSAAGSFAMPTSNVTLHAQWVADLYRVVYNANGGVGAPSDQVLATDSTVTVSSTVPTRTGHDFLYWTATLNRSGSTYANPASGLLVDNFTMPPSNTTLYAQWAVRSYQFAYDANGGSGAPSGASTAYGTTVTVSSTVPTHVGHTFVGWNTSPNGSGSSYVDGNTLSMPDNALTLHAQWVADTFSIVYFANGGTSAPAAQSATYGSTASVSATPATRLGYTFDGWNTQTNGQGTVRAGGSSFTMSNANVELYAQWTAQSFAVAFNANDGTAAPNNISGTTDSTVTIPSTIPTRSGYDFLGWNTLQAGTGIAYQVGSTLAMPPNNLVLWAQWQARRFSVVYNVNGGATNAPVGTLAVTDSSVQTESTTPSRIGYQFAGWNTQVDGSGVAALAGANFSMPPSDVTLFAQWSAVIYTVTYDANGGSGAPASQSAGTDSTVTVSPTVPTRTRYTFTGWNTQADGSGIAYGTAATFTMPASNVSLYAQWALDPEPPAPSAPSKPSESSASETPSAPVTTAPLPVVGQLMAPEAKTVMSGRTVEINPLRQDPPAGDAWDKSTISLYAIAAISAQSTFDTRIVSVSRVARLKTKGGVWKVDVDKGTVSFVAAENFVGRDRVGFAVTTKLGVEYRTILTVTVKALPSKLPVTGGEVPIGSALWLLVVGLLMLCVARVRPRRI